MKVSQYNSIYDFPSNPSQKLMFNAKSLALALVDCSKVEQYENYCQTHEEIPDEAFLNDLKTGGFLIDDSIDEKAILKYEQLCSRYSRSHLSLVIAATSNCNFRCVYCYERSVLRASTMSEATQEAIVKFVESEAPHLESFTVTWYGGEPLLALDIIESLSLKFIDICKKNDIAYGATIVTNGYLLNCAVVEKLNTLYVNQYQVTLDGRKEIHDCSRPLANGGGTYDVITQNLIDVKDVIPSVSLRINTGRHNVDQVHEIFEWVKDNGLSEKVFPYLGKITSTGKEDPTTSMCLNTDEFVEARIKMINGIIFIPHLSDVTVVQIPTMCSSSTPMVLSINAGMTLVILSGLLATSTRILSIIALCSPIFSTLLLMIRTVATVPFFRFAWVVAHIAVYNRCPTGAVNSRITLKNFCL